MGALVRCVSQAAGGVKVRWRCVSPAVGQESRWGCISCSRAWCSRSPPSAAAAEVRASTWAIAAAAKPARGAKSCGRKRSWRCTSIKVSRGGANGSKRIYSEGGSVTRRCVNQVWKTDRRLFSMGKETRNRDWNRGTSLSSWSRSHILSSPGTRQRGFIFKMNIYDQTARPALDHTLVVE